MFTKIAIALAILWLLGLVANVGSVIHALIVIALVLIAYDLLVGRRRSRV
jgi:uncharacterized membrane protein